jgi:16S rRNA (adenine1518-N6/adenine1519-N6)-dimethyltransferase
VLSVLEIIKKYNILANKSLGQNFLINEEVCKKIALSGDLCKNDIILEVGPGLGSLTRALVGFSFNKLYLIERDERFISILQNEYPSVFELLHADALKFDFTSVGEDIKILANLPYNIGTELLTNWISLIKRPKMMVLMLQKEVVERITAKPKSKSYGRLSVLCQAFYDVEKLFDVSAGCFVPAPNVISSVVRMKRKEVDYDPKMLGKITEKLFSSRRKILKNALLSLNIKREDIYNKRAEELTVEDFISLIKPYIA